MNGIGQEGHDVGMGFSRVWDEVSVVPFTVVIAADIAYGMLAVRYYGKSKCLRLYFEIVL